MFPDDPPMTRKEFDILLDWIEKTFRIPIPGWQRRFAWRMVNR